MIHIMYIGYFPVFFFFLFFSSWFMNFSFPSYMLVCLFVSFFFSFLLSRKKQANKCSSFNHNQFICNEKNNVIRKYISLIELNEDKIFRWISWSIDKWYVVILIVFCIRWAFGSLHLSSIFQYFKDSNEEFNVIAEIIVIIIFIQGVFVHNHQISLVFEVQFADMFKTLLE